MKYIFLRSLALPGLIVGLPLFAQQMKISGTVTDPHEAVVVAAEVQVINQATQAVIKTKTDGAGVFQITQLQSGRYLMSVRAKGFQITDGALRTR